MNAGPADLDVGGVLCFAAGDAALSYQYVPGEPAPASDPAGRPAITLWVIPPRPMLQLTTLWRVGDDQLQQLRTAIHPGDPAAVQLAPAPLSVDRVTVSIGDAAGGMTEAASGASSGFPPYQTAFSLGLDEEGAARAVSALGGARSQVQVSYHGRYRRPVTAAAAIAGDVSEDAAALGPDATEQDAVDRVEAAIGAGRLVVTRSPDQGVPDAVRDDLERQLRARAAGDLLELARRGASGSLQDAMTTTYQVPVDVVRTTDVGTWFPAGEGSTHIHVLGTTSP